MVWFSCGNCNDTVKKAKVQQHAYSCGSYEFTCVDCLSTFDRETVKGHTTCVTEHEKYALAVTKPGGAAAKGVQQQAVSCSGQQSAEPAGLEYLSTRPPWKCSICNVSCTSRETLLSHATGVKHKRRARAASGANGAQTAAQPENGDAQQREAPADAPANGNEEKKRKSDSAAEEGAAKKAKQTNGHSKPAQSSSSSESEGSDDEEAGPQQNGKKAAANGHTKAESKEANGDASKQDTGKSGKKAAKGASKEADEQNGGSEEGGKGASKEQKKRLKQVKKQLEQEEKLDAVLKQVQKKLKSKGKVVAKRLAKIAAAALEVEADALEDQAALDLVMDKVVGAGVAQRKGKKLVPVEAAA